MQVAAGRGRFRARLTPSGSGRPAGASPFPARRLRRPLLWCCGPSLAGAGWAPSPRPALPLFPVPPRPVRGARPPGALGRLRVGSSLLEALRGLAGLRGGSGAAREKGRCRWSRSGREAEGRGSMPLPPFPCGAVPAARTVSRCKAPPPRYKLFWRGGKGTCRLSCCRHRCQNLVSG